MLQKNDAKDSLNVGQFLNYSVLPCSLYRLYGAKHRRNGQVRLALLSAKVEAQFVLTSERRLISDRQIDCTQDVENNSTLYVPHPAKIDRLWK